MEIIYNLSGSNKEKKSSKIKTNFEKISGFSGQELVFRKKKKKYRYWQTAECSSALCTLPNGSWSCRSGQGFQVSSAPTTLGFSIGKHCGAPLYFV